MGLNSFLVLIYLVGCYYISPSNAQKPFIIAHMANTPGSVRWALDNGAAGVEMDLNFDRCGNPTEFKHGGVCDCSCLCAANGRDCDSTHICHQLWVETGSHCGASTPAGNMFDFLSSDGIREKLSVIYIDSKLNNELIEYYGAGAIVVKMINERVFDRGYTGQVIISGLEFKYIEYLRGAMYEAKSSKYGDKYFYTFDGEGKDYDKVWNGLLQLRTPNIVYATGITICLGTKFDDAIQNSVNKGGYAGIGIWTLDKQSSMESYLDLGVSAIVTNDPSAGVKAIDAKRLERLQPGEQALYPKQSVPAPDSNFSWGCDCNYHKGKSFWGGGGCSIMTPPPPGNACKCKYVGAWTCKGENVGCRDSSSGTCTNPDMSKSTCDFGGGDCKGYQC